MKIPLAYPKIPDTTNFPCKHCVVFEKYDGTNLHWVWHKELGWYAFGTRRDRFDLDAKGIAEFNEAHPGLEEAVEIFHRTYAKLGEYPIPHKYAPTSPLTHEVVLFTEFLGNQSFAGSHIKDDPKRLVLLDVATDQGITLPHQFIIDFGQFDDVPQNLSGSKISDYHIAIIHDVGKYSGQLVEDIRRGKYNVNEGAVIKGVLRGKVYMAKVKTEQYMQRLKDAFQDKWKDYWE